MRVHFSIEYKTRWGESLILVSGNDRFPMTYNEGGIWTADAEVGRQFLSSYHYEVELDGVFERSEWDSHSHKASGDYASFTDSWIDPPADGNGIPHKLSVPIFDKKGWKGAGTAVPVFSLRSRDGFGVGEFLDLKKLVDWAAATGQSIIQLLPVNDTTRSGSWVDSYPYSAISSFALHPQFVNLEAAGLKPTPAFRKLKQDLNELPAIDYERVNSEKARLLRKLFAEQGAEVLESKEYKTFVRDNKRWLLPYAAFCVLRDKLGTADFSKWGTYAKHSDAKVRTVAKEHKADVEFYCYVQFLLDRQLKEAHDYARAKGVCFKGDLPIGISRDSVDAWCFPELFNMDSQAGAPPDFFSRDGQNWGFPTYNWEAMARDGYLWWRERLGKMAEYFDAFRIDHLLGFFRIWEIPVPEKSGLMGHFNPAMPYSADEIAIFPKDGLFLEDPHRPGWYHPSIAGRDSQEYAWMEDWRKREYDRLYDDFFYHRHDEFWRRQALRKLPVLLGCTGMLACGEDLGMIPDCVPGVMASLKILSLELQRMPKGQGETFGDTTRYPYMSVCATSSHDIAPLMAWWEEDRSLSEYYWREVMHRGGEAPLKCTTDIVRSAINMHLESPSMLCIIPIQDWLATDEELRFKGDPATERINIPAISQHYWRYRMHVDLDDLLAAGGFTASIRDMIARAGR